MPKAVITLAFYLIFILKRAYAQLPSIYTCFHLVIPRTKSSVYVNDNNLLCMKKERSSSRKKPGHADSKIEKKKDLYKGELNPAKDHNTRDISFIFGIKTPHFRRPALQKAPTRKFHSYFFKYHILSITCTEIFTCLDIFSVIFCFRVILGDNFSFPGQPID